MTATKHAFSISLSLFSSSRFNAERIHIPISPSPSAIEEIGFVGCMISCACNYDASSNIADDAQCVFDGCDGCTYADASNYDESAVADNGSCVFDIANACPADLNGDGSITTGDLLIFLGAFGTICE